MIRALNSFLAFVEKDLPVKIKRCPLFDSEVQSKDETYLISEDELNELCGFFEANGVDSLYLKTLYYTGMRAKEALGLSIVHVVFGDKLASKEFVYKYLKENGMQQYGYIFLQKQLLNDTNSKILEFGPLKSRRENDRGLHQ